MDYWRFRTLMLSVPEFRSGFMMCFTPYDLALAMAVMRIRIHAFERARYLNLIRDIPLPTDWIDEMIMCGNRVVFLGSGLDMLTNRISDPLDYVDRFGWMPHIEIGMIVLDPSLVRKLMMDANATDCVIWGLPGFWVEKGGWWSRLTKPGTAVCISCPPACMTQFTLDTEAEIRIEYSNTDEDGNFAHVEFMKDIPDAIMGCGLTRLGGSADQLRYMLVERDGCRFGTAFGQNVKDMTRGPPPTPMPLKLLLYHSTSTFLIPVSTIRFPEPMFDAE